MVLHRYTLVTSTRGTARRRGTHSALELISQVDDLGNHQEAREVYSILYIIGAIVVIIVILRLLGLY